MVKRRSPDSIICFDLTEDIICFDLTEDDDDERDEKLQDVCKRLKNGTAPSAATEANVKVEGVAAARSTEPAAKDNDDGGGKIGSCASLQQQQQQQAIKQDQQATEGSLEVQIVEPVARTILCRPVAATHHASTSSTAANEEVIIVGTANESRLPHMRQHCPENKFVPNVIYLSNRQCITEEQRKALTEAKLGNRACCDLCFCYVCDKPAKDCTKWLSSSQGMMHFSQFHCHASETGPDAPGWLNLRAAAKIANPPLDPTRAVGDGPFAPDHELASKDADLTQCRKCGWYNRFEHRNFARLQQDKKQLSFYGLPKLHPTGCLDWCHCCG